MVLPGLPPFYWTLELPHTCRYVYTACLPTTTLLHYTDSFLLVLFYAVSWNTTTTTAVLPLFIYILGFTGTTCIRGSFLLFLYFPSSDFTWFRFTPPAGSFIFVLPGFSFWFVSSCTLPAVDSIPIHYLIPAFWFVLLLPFPNVATTRTTMPFEFAFYLDSFVSTTYHHTFFVPTLHHGLPPPPAYSLPMDITSAPPPPTYLHLILHSTPTFTVSPNISHLHSTSSSIHHYRSTLQLPAAFVHIYLPPSYHCTTYTYHYYVLLYRFDLFICHHFYIPVYFHSTILCHRTTITTTCAILHLLHHHHHWETTTRHTVHTWFVPLLRILDFETLFYTPSWFHRLPAASSFCSTTVPVPTIDMLSHTVHHFPAHHHTPAHSAVHTTLRSTTYLPVFCTFYHHLPLFYFLTHTIHTPPKCYYWFLCLPPMGD